MNPSKIVIGTSVLVLALSAGLGVFETQRIDRFRAQIPQSNIARNSARQHSAKLQGNNAVVASAASNETQARIANIETELTRAQKESCDLQEKLSESATEIVHLLKRIEEIEGWLPIIADSTKGPTAVLQTKLDEAVELLNVAEREKALLADKITTSRHSPSVEAGKRKRLPGGGDPGIRGSVLAVNHAYNFVVLSLGGRQGVEANSEMIVWRDSTFIGKIRISSVEPATAIGDIIGSSLARGVQVQPGDTVIYAGTN